MIEEVHDKAFVCLVKIAFQNHYNPNSAAAE
jgi:hypothetical protein